MGPKVNKYTCSNHTIEINEDAKPYHAKPFLIYALTLTFGDIYAIIMRISFAVLDHL